MPKVSVVIPFYNSERYIGEAISSVLKQTFTDYEIIAVDDGSTDGSAEIVKNYGKAIRYFYHANSGVAKTRNVGVALSQGQYVAFLDSDDQWHREKLERQVFILDHSPNIGVVISDAESIAQDGTKINKRLIAYNPQDPYCRLFTKGYVLFTSALLLRRNVYEKAGAMDEGFIGACLEDLEWEARLCEISDIYYIDQVLTLYRWHPANTPSDVEERNTFLFIQKMLDRYGSCQERRRYLIGKKIGFLSDIGNRRIKTGRVAEGRKYLWESISLNIQNLVNAVNAKVLIRSLIRVVRSYL